MRIYKLLVVSLSVLSLSARYDVTVIGPMIHADGLGRISIGFIEHLCNDLRINFIPTNEKPIDFKDISLQVQQVVKRSLRAPSNVSILFDQLWTATRTPAAKVPNSPIKIAYSMIESNAIPIQWVKILNTQFDAVAVPDKFLCTIYRKCGVTIPIFVLPHGIYLEDFLALPVKEKSGTPFTFGMSAGFFSTHKNHELLIEAFAKEFGNDSKVRLRVHGRCGDVILQNRVQDRIRSLKCKNIEFVNKTFSHKEYLTFMSSLDCYVLLSKGEGYSLTPREALALGIPCIITNNSAHGTICETGFVKEVKAPVSGLARYIPFRAFCGYNYNCTLDDACSALREVYNNYAIYLEKAHKGREWVRQYLYPNLKSKYLSLIKPKKVVLDTYNSIEEDCLITDSEKLYKKYTSIL